MADNIIMNDAPEDHNWGDRSLPAGPTIPNAPAQGGGIGANAPTATVEQRPPTPMAPAASPWQKLFTIMAQGLAGSAGQTTFAGGMAGGARASLAQHQMDVENKQKQQRLDQEQQTSDSTARFQSAQAANMASEAALRDAHLHALPQQLQDAHDTLALETIKTLNDMGLTPTIQFPNNVGGAEAKAALEQVSNSHGGVPPMFSVVMGKQVVSYDLNKLADQPQALDQINRIRALQGQQKIDQMAWQKMPPQVKVDQTNNAFKFFNPELSEKNLQEYKNYLLTQKKAAEVNPKDDDVKSNVKKLEGVVNYLQTGLDELNKRENKQAAAKAGGIAAAQYAAKQKDDQQSYDDYVKLDQTGWTPKGLKLSDNQIVAAQNKYANGQPFKNAEDAERSYQMMSAAYANRGNAKTGAESMVALSTHLQTTFGAVKGARVTKDMIEHHLGARSITDDALVATQKAFNGDVLSPAQWDAFHSLIGQSRKLAWDNASRHAHVMGLPVTSDMLPDDLMSPLTGGHSKAGTGKPNMDLINKHSGVN